MKTIKNEYLKKSKINVTFVYVIHILGFTCFISLIIVLTVWLTESMERKTSYLKTRCAENKDRDRSFYVFIRYD